MASPLKFLARLTARLRVPKQQQDDVTEDVKSTEGASLEAVGPTIDYTLDPNGQQDEGGFVRQTDAFPIEPKSSALGGGIAKEEAGLGNANSVEAAGRSIHDDGDFHPFAAPDMSQSSSSSKRPIARAGRMPSHEATVKLVEVSLQRPPSAMTFSNEMQNLDQEIALLREKLIRKLHLQNAQLRLMLKRFES